MKEQIGDWNTLSDREQLEFIIYQVKTLIPYNPIPELGHWEYIVEWLNKFELSRGEVYCDFELGYNGLSERMKRKNSRDFWNKLTPKEQFLVIADYWEETIEKRKLRKKPGRKPKNPTKPGLVRIEEKGLRDVFKYNPDTGAIRRKDAPDISIEYIDNNCWNVWCNKRIPSHRLAVRIMLGEIDKGARIIHINGDRFDNRWSNLKVIPPYKHDRIYTRFRHDGEIVNLGYVDTLEERAQRIEHYRGLRAIGVDHETAVRESKNGLK